MYKYTIIWFSLLALSKGAKEGPDVVNGIDAKLEAIPYQEIFLFQVSLEKLGRPFCGGSIITPYYVLTAGHCSDEFSIFTYFLVSVAAGMIDIEKPDQRRYMRKFITAPNFNIFNVRKNDIALVRLWTPFVFNSKMQPVKLPKSHQTIAANTEVLLTGWGLLRGGPDKKRPRILQQAVLHVVDQSECKRLIESNGHLKLYETNLCAYDSQVRRGQCSGDSGGPLVSTLDSVQVGVVSWSYKDPYCASTETPGVYARVPDYVDWIKETTN